MISITTLRACFDFKIPLALKEHLVESLELSLSNTIMASKFALVRKWSKYQKAGQVWLVISQYFLSEEKHIHFLCNQDTLLDLLK